MITRSPNPQAEQAQLVPIDHRGRAGGGARPAGPEAGRLAARGAHPAGGLRGRRRARRRHRPPAPGAAGGPAPPRTLSRPELRAPRPVRACLAQVRDSIPRVVLLGRLCLYGRRAERLHEEIVPLAARWVEPARRGAPLKAYAREAEARTLQLLEQSLAGRPEWIPHEVIRTKLLATTPRDVEELLPQLEPRADEIAELATRRLRERGTGRHATWKRRCAASASASSKSSTATRAATPRSPWTSTTTSGVSSRPTCATGTLASTSSTAI